MKPVKVRIKRGRPGEDAMVYPARYDPQEVDREGIGPTNVNGVMAYSGHLSRGGTAEWCYIVLPDLLADEYAQDVDMEIGDAVTADADMEQWRVDNGYPAEVVDEARVSAITAKQAAGITLSQTDRDALDPKKPEKGVRKALRSVSEIVTEANAARV